MAQAFAAWVDFTNNKAVAADNATRALGFWQNRAAAEAFAAWKDFAIERQQLREKLQTAAAFWMHASLRYAFDGWLEGAAYMQEKKLAVRKAVVCFSNRYGQACMLKVIECLRPWLASPVGMVNSAC